jgi:hypothetical protein
LLAAIYVSENQVSLPQFADFSSPFFRSSTHANRLSDFFFSLKKKSRVRREGRSGNHPKRTGKSMGRGAGEGHARVLRGPGKWEKGTAFGLPLGFFGLPLAFQKKAPKNFPGGAGKIRPGFRQQF